MFPRRKAPPPPARHPFTTCCISRSPRRPHPLAPPPPQQPAVKGQRLPSGWTRTSKVDGKGETRYRIASPGGSRSASYPADAWRVYKGEAKKTGHHNRNRGAHAAVE
eukprot:2047876-Prymnesium_polylepis.1